MTENKSERQGNEKTDEDGEMGPIMGGSPSLVESIATPDLF